ncbi:restriction endonuclease subunit S [Bifidobacterium bifidum]|uniref:restriction endonuclease subunit S n=1 Tax=Bifidobacterium bifidum TaxID=1681 RepID=UPI00233008CB|nr:restriction endonuclease subunit S [Bifidobacterium bifidum]MDB1249930.1 restriction endonuclease subunit S [Bifidobacterium bifidum]
MVTGTTSPSTRYERISVSPASCSIKSEYVIASHAFKPQYKCINYTPAWEQRKLGELSSEFQSGDFISAEKILASGPYPVYGGNGLRGYAKRYNHDGFYALIGRQGALCGNVNTAVGKAYFTEHAVAIKANSLHDTRFLVHLLRCMDLGQYSGQSAQPGLAVGVLKEVETTVPSKVEQQAIGSFFSRLDDLITLHQRKRESRIIRVRSFIWLAGDISGIGVSAYQPEKRRPYDRRQHQRRNVVLRLLRAMDQRIQGRCNS